MMGAEHEARIKLADQRGNEFGELRSTAGNRKVSSLNTNSH